MSDPINVIIDWFTNLLAGWGLSEGLINIINSVLGSAIVATLGMVTVIFLIWLERKIAGRIQDRFGPNRAGPYGLLQPIADMIKIFTKEIISPEGVDKVPFTLAPIMLVASVLFIWAVIPFSSTVFGTDISVGVLYIVAVGAIGVVAIIMAGWSSNNKFALVGAFRAVAQMVSYEIPMVLAMMVPVLMSRSMNVTGVVEAQIPWFVFIAPGAALIFLIASMAEVGRAPFDLLEAESEIVAGYHTEYSGITFGMFYVGEFLHVWTVGALIATFFLGGWRGPGAETIPVLGIIYFYFKTFIGYFLVTWIRLSLPRTRIDQMMNFCWKVLTPLGLALLIVTAILDKLLYMINPKFQLGDSGAWVYSLVMLAANLLVGWITVQIIRQQSTEIEPEEFEIRPIAVAPKPTEN